jgi:hypothetical protein
MTVLLSPVGGVAAQFFDNNGNPLSGGKLFSYAAGTTTPAATYTSSLGVTAHTNPIVLDSGGRVPGGEIWLTDGVIYKFVLQTSTNVLIATYDNIVGINSNFVNYTTEQEIQTATAGQTVFNLTTTQYQPGTNSLSVYVDGVNQYGPGAQYAYFETDSDTVTFVSGLHVGASVKFTTATQTTGNATNASVVTYTPPFTNSVTTNVEDKLAQTVSVKDFGATGDGTTNDYAALNNAESSANQLMFPKGTYLVESSITFAKTPIFQNGAVLKIRNGAVVTFTQGIDAGWYTIFDTTDDFITDLTINTSVKIFGCPVKSDWFAAKVQDLDDIKTIPDQSNNLTKAFRAAVGNYIVRSATQFINEYQQGVVELGVGYYRIDETLAFGKQTAPTIFYQLGGFTFRGQGAGASYLIRTDLSSTDICMFLAFYTAELTHFEKFKISCYDPDSVTPFDSSARSIIFMQGDSLQINNVWVSGAQVPVVTGDVYQNGVGFQFSSCVDTFFHDLFAEYCVTGVAFHSAIVSGNNLTLFTTGRQAIGLGNFQAEYGVSQTTSSIVNISGVQANNLNNQGIYVLETGNTSKINISNSWFSGFNSEFGTQTGGNFCNFRGGTRLQGSWTAVDIISFNGRTFNVQQNCFLGNPEQAFVLQGFTIDSNTAAPSGFGVFCAEGTGVYVNLFVDGMSCSDLYGPVINGTFASGNMSLSNVTLSRYTGAADTSASRQLFVIGSGTSAPQLQLYNWTRNAADTVALTQFGFCGGSAINTKLYIDINNLYLATRTVGGTYASVQMPTLTAFV